MNKLINECLTTEVELMTYTKIFNKINIPETVYLNKCDVL